MKLFATIGVFLLAAGSAYANPSDNDAGIQALVPLFGATPATQVMSGHTKTGEACTFSFRGQAAADAAGVPFAFFFGQIEFASMAKGRFVGVFLTGSDYKPVAGYPSGDNEINDFFNAGAVTTFEASGRLEPTGTQKVGDFYHAEVNIDLALGHVITVTAGGNSSQDGVPVLEPGDVTGCGFEP